MIKLSGEQQTEETDKAYRAFLMYIDHQRDEKSFLNSCNIRKSTYSHWKRQWQWGNRTTPNLEAKDAQSVVDSVNRKQLSQSLEAAGSLQSFLDIINRKIDESKNEIEEMSLDQLVKLTGNLSKAMHDIINRLPQLNVDEEEKCNDKSEELRLARLIQNDESATKLASNLLARVSEIVSEKD